MQIIQRLLFFIVLASFNVLAFADDLAPVYEAEAYTPSQYENQADDNSGSTPNYSGAPTMTLEQRVNRLEQAQENQQHSTNSSAKVESLQTQVQELRAEVEDLQKQLKQVKTNSDDIKKLQTAIDQLNEKYASKGLNPNRKAYPKVDENTDISNKKNKDPDSADTTTTDASNENQSDVDTSDNPQQPNIAEEQQIYQSAYNYIKDKKYDQAVGDLQKMLQKYPSGQFAANAHYWLGELYNLMGNNSQSATEFNTVVDKFPSSAKVPDAQLKLGMIYATQSKWSDAKSSFKKVIKKYPGTASARLASEQLKQIKSAGH